MKQEIPKQAQSNVVDQIDGLIGSLLDLNLEEAESLYERFPALLALKAQWQREIPDVLPTLARPRTVSNEILAWRTKVEEELRAIQQRYTEILDSIQDIFYSVDSQWRFIFVNQAAERSWGKNRENLIGKVVWEVFPDAVGGSTYAQLHQAMRKRQVLRFETISIVLHTWVEVHIFPAADGGLSVYYRDISDRKGAEEALRASENRLRRIFEMSVIGIIDRHIDGSILSVNDAMIAMLGYSRDEFQAQPRNVYELIPEEYHPVEREIVAEVLATGSSRPHEKDFIRKDGSRMPVLVGHTLLEGDPAEIIGFVVDLSELKQTQAALQEYTKKLARSNQELEHFAFVASHDLQEPLRKIRMFGNSLEKKLGDSLPQDAADYLARMQNAAERMQKMIDGLLELSRVNTQGGNFEPVDLNALVREAVSDLETRIQSSGGRVEVSDLPAAEVDALQARRLFQNLIGNALKFHRPGVPPLVRVSGKVVRSEKQQSVQITVADNGIGFEEGEAERIFKPFQRLHSREQFEGTGMGLAICQRIAERHHGKIEVRSIPDEGTSFTVTLPVKQAG